MSAATWPAATCATSAASSITNSRVPLFLFKAPVALLDSTDYINSYCACVQSFGDAFSSRHHRSATATVMLSASKTMQRDQLWYY